MARSFPTLSRRGFIGLAAAGAAFAVLPPRSLAQHLDATLTAVFDADWWWGAFRSVTLMALGSVPLAGGVLSFFGALFIPTHLFDSEDAQWRRYIDAVNKIVDDKIDDAIYLQVQASLVGFTRTARLFVSALQTGDTQHIRTVIDSMNVAFTASMQGFMLREHEARLLPLFVPVANLHLGLLRQAVQLGRLEGYPPAVILDYQSQLQASIDDYGQYYDDVVLLQLQAAARTHPHDGGNNRNQPLAAVYELRSRLQASLGDTRDCWKYFDTERYPDAVKVLLNREVFSILVGSYFDDKVPEPTSVDLPEPPTGPIRGITLQGYVFVDGMTFSYAHGQGPGRVDQVRVGGMGGIPRRYDDIVERGHVRAVLVQHGYAVDSLALEYGDGTMTACSGDTGNQDRTLRIAFSGHHLSSVVGFGTADGYGGVLSGCMFGFQLDEPSVPVALESGVLNQLQRALPGELRSGLPNHRSG